MFFQFTLSQIRPYIPFIVMGVLLLVGVLVFRIGLAITKANVKINTKWVFGSFFIQFGLIFFISTPMILSGVSGGFVSGGFNIGMIAPIIIFSAFIDMQVVNVLHRIGLKRSLVIVILILIPISFAILLLSNNMGTFIGLI